MECKKHGSIMTRGTYSDKPEFREAHRKGFFCKQCIDEIKARPPRAITHFSIEYLKDEIFIQDRLRAHAYLTDNTKFQKLQSFYRGMLYVIDILGLQDEIGV